jgi:hypothetical protein
LSWVYFRSSQFPTKHHRLPDPVDDIQTCSPQRNIPAQENQQLCESEVRKPMVQSSKRLFGLSNTEAGRIVSRHEISTCRFQEFSKISLMLHESPGVYQRRSSSINLEDPINPIFLNRDSIGSYLPVSATLLRLPLKPFSEICIQAPSSKPSAKFAHV